MQMSEVAVCTPGYLLMDGKRCSFPKVLTLDSGRICRAIYGFSGKGFYDKFSLLSDLALTPYPLVKGYLRNQIDSAGDGLRLVVVDAAGPDETDLHAATMEAVLEAQENRTSHVTAKYRLTFDQNSNAYTVIEAEP